MAASRRIREIAAALQSYRFLRDQVDQLCTRIATAHADALLCRAGCADCCRLTSVLPVEAASLHLAWHALPAAGRRRLRDRFAAPQTGEACPLLENALCSLYADRPIICRTHGLPLLIENAGGTRVDRCPLNFTGYTVLPGTAVIHLERLNTALVSINRQFVARVFPDGGLPERIPLQLIADLPLPA
jgi:hypothetical protein